MTGPPELHGRLPVSDAWSMWHVVSAEVLVLASFGFAIDPITRPSGNDVSTRTLRTGFEPRLGIFLELCYSGGSGIRTYSMGMRGAWPDR